MMSDSLPQNWAECLVTGIPVDSGQSIPPRKEIRSLTNDERTLFLEGLALFQARDPAHPLSYYQIAGIHGKPFTPWPNVGWNKDFGDPNNVSAGFCTHSSIIFVTWHRPYLALFERELYQHVQAAAQKRGGNFPSLAKSFRLPYWDWALRVDPNNPQAPFFPREATEDFPSDVKSKIGYNPLFCYPFVKSKVRDWDDDNSPFNPRHRSSTTFRNSGFEAVLQKQLSNRTVTPGAQPDALGVKFKEARNLSERTAYLLSSYLFYGSMSNDQYTPSKPTDKTWDSHAWGSIEGIHNNVHGMIGGTMGTFESPYDPIFWLHHANIDRLCAIWQGLHEDPKDDETWVKRFRVGQPNFSNDFFNYDKEDGQTPLYPFRYSANGVDNTGSGKWWTSDDNGNIRTGVRNIERLGYTYDDLVGIPYPYANKPKLIQTLNDKYKPGAWYIQQSIGRVRTAGQSLLPQASLVKQLSIAQTPATHAESLKLVDQMPDQQTLLERSLEPEKPFIRDLAPDNKYLEWLVNIKAERHSLGGRYSVHIFLGPADEDEAVLWDLSPHHVGMFNPFGQASNTNCARCQDQQRNRLQITAQIPLTVALIERYLAQMIPDITTATIVPYLQQNLHWRVRLDDNALDNRSQVDGLTVFVVSNEVTLPDDPSQLPTYAHDVAIHPEITTNREGNGRGDGTGLTAGDIS